MGRYLPGVFASRSATQSIKQRLFFARKSYALTSLPRPVPAPASPSWRGRQRRGCGKRERWGREAEDEYLDEIVCEEQRRKEGGIEGKRIPDLKGQADQRPIQHQNTISKAEKRSYKKENNGRISTHPSTLIAGWKNNNPR